VARIPVTGSSNGLGRAAAPDPLRPFRTALSIREEHQGTVVWSTAGGTLVSVVIGAETRVRVFVWKPSVHLFWESRMRVVSTGSP
jgi:hypothetical protein